MATPGGSRGLRSSSPLHFPTSSEAGTPRASRTNALRSNNLPPSSSPLQFPTSSPRQPPSSAQRPPPSSSRLRALHSDAANSPLFFPSSPDATPRRQRRGDINPSYSSPSLARQVPRRPSHSAPGTPADGHQLSVVGHSQDPDMMGEDEDGYQKFIWGTNVSLNDTRIAFREFLEGFKPKYRAVYNDKRRQEIIEDGGIPPPPVALYEDLPADKADRLLYISYVEQMRETGQSNLNLDAVNLLAYPPTKKLYHQLMNFPQEVIPIFDSALHDIFSDKAQLDLDDANIKHSDGLISEEERKMFELERADVEKRPYRVRPFAGDKTINLRDLNPGDTDKLISIKGLVIRATPVIPEMNEAFFRCSVCQNAVEVEVDRGRVNEPQRCGRDVCGVIGSMTLIHNRSGFIDKQIVRLQETPDSVPDGQTPHTVTLCVYNDLVDHVKPGDRVIVTGIFRSTPVRVNPRQRTIKSLFKTYVDVVHVKRTNTGRMGFDPSTRQGENNPGVGVGGRDDEDELLAAVDDAADEDTNEITQSAANTLEREMRTLGAHPDIYDMLSRSMAPSIYELDDVKKGILLQLFGGTNKSITAGGGGGGPRYRGDINVLMVGDPGTAKSQILQYVHKIAPRGVYTSGKGSSAVGLTAYVTRDPDSKQLVLESGALVLSDGGVCCIDEFDKMSDATRSVLHEVMEQQTVSIAKAGIITTLNARTSILAAANPVGSRYNPKLPIPANIDLPPTLISRFDLLYLVLDKVDEANDRRLAAHLLSLYLEDRPDTGGADILPVETLTAYITYARAKIHPVLTAEASDELVRCYVEMRKAGEDARSAERRITATTRQLESMIRLSEAHARMRLCETVDLCDVQEASRLIRSALRESATDPLTGQIDLDLITTGAGQSARRQRADLRNEILLLISAAGARGIRWSAAIRQMEAQSTVPIDHHEFGEVVRALADEGVLKVMGEKEKRVIKKLGVE